MLTETRFLHWGGLIGAVTLTTGQPYFYTAVATGTLLYYQYEVSMYVHC